MGTLGNTIRAAVAPVARNLVADVGRAQVRLVRAEITRTATNAEQRDWLPVFGAQNVPVTITEPRQDAIQREWGTAEQVSAVMLITDAVVLAKNDGVIVLSGDFAGRHFRVLRWIPSPYAGLNRVALQTTPERYA